MNAAQKVIPLPTILDPPPRAAPPPTCAVPPPDVGDFANLDDSRLGVLAGAGHMAAWEELYERQHAALLGYALSLKNSSAEAEDLVQDTFLRAWQNGASYDPNYPYHTWLRTILIRLSMSLGNHRDVRRRAHAACGIEEDAGGRWMATTPVPADVRAEEADVAHRITSVLAMLTPDDRVLLEAWSEGARAVDLAEEMESTDGSMRAQLFRAKKRFAALYLERYGDLDVL